MEEIPRRSSRDWRGTLIALSMFILLLDRVTKKLIERYVPVDGAIPVIPHIFRISHVENAGAAFSLFGNSPSPGRVRWLLIGFSLLAAVVVLGFLIKLGRRLTPMTVALALILGGAIGNAYDRIRYGYVIDFVEVHIIHYHWPDFNVADSAIVIGGILLVLDSLRSVPDRS
ncbi:MAG: signal peptidase II [Acidobacteriaceae bacterium]